MSLVPVAWPNSESEMVVIGSLLQANDIPYFVHGAGLASMLPGLQISAYNTRIVMVPVSAATQATEVLSALATDPDNEGSPAQPASSFVGNMRLVLETLFFGWFIPRNASRARSERDDA